MKAVLTAAERILQSLGIADPQEIDLEAIAWTQGAVVNYRPLDGCEARILGSARKAVISVNSRSPERRRRFSMAHELGHWHHHRGQVLFCGKDDIGNFANDAMNPERHADAFASDLILPNYLLAPRLNKIKRPTLAAARDLSDEFCASLTATLIKMTLSNQFPMVIACYNKTKRRWFERAPMIQPWWLPVRALDRQTFAADMLFNGAAEENFPRKMPADTWFDFIGSDRFEVTEQSFRLPDEEILTVLTLPDAAIAVRCIYKSSRQAASCAVCGKRATLPRNVDRAIRKPQCGRNRTNGWNVKWPSIRAWGQYHSRRYWIDGRRIRAAPKAPQRKRPCRSRALSVDPSRSFVRCAQPILRGGSR